MGLDPVTMAANSVTATTNQPIWEFMMQIVPDDLTEMRRRPVMLVINLSSCL